MNNGWRKQRTICSVKSDWINLHCEEFVVQQQSIEYWRVERSSSLIVVVTLGDSFVVTKNNYRPGVDLQTLDFPGGRYDEGDIFQAAQQILKRELGLDKQDYTLNSFVNNGYFVDSSFSSQRVYYIQAKVNPAYDVTSLHANTVIYNSSKELFKDLLCLQCRSALLEYMFASSQIISD